MNRVKIENSHFPEKIFLREYIIKKYSLNNFKVLDCFHAEGKIWDTIKNKSNINFDLIGIEIDSTKKSIFPCIYQDNLRILKSINLDDFQIIDLDAYGNPFKQLKILYDRKYSGHIFLTFINVAKGGSDLNFLEFIGYSKKMVRKVHTLFAKNSFKKLKIALSKMGVDNILYISKEDQKKIYLWFYLNPK
jgi:hypothetical protein